MASPRTIGIDMSAQPKGTAWCAIGWSDAGGKVEGFSGSSGVADKELLELIRSQKGRIGIDVPLGWPAEFVRSLAQYARGELWDTRTDRALRLRRTDEFVHDRLQLDGAKALWPLSVAADLIAHPAMRVAAVLSTAQLSGMPRDGSGPIVEVYPASALSQWRLPCTAYKAKNIDNRCNLVDRILAVLGARVQVTDEQRERLRSSDNCLDAFVAALIVRCHETGWTYPVPPESAVAARCEGWVALPKPGSLTAVSSS